jgi:hypothetical protein
MFDHFTLEFKPLLPMHLKHLLHNHALHQSTTSMTNFSRCCQCTTTGSISKYGLSLQQDKRNLIRSNMVNKFTIQKKNINGNLLSITLKKTHKKFKNKIVSSSYVS